MKNKCNCDLCKRDRKFERIMKDIMRPWEEKLYCYDERRRANRNIKWLRDLYQEFLKDEEYCYEDVGGKIRSYYKCQK